MDRATRSSRSMTSSMWLGVRSHRVARSLVESPSTSTPRSIARHPLGDRLASSTAFFGLPANQPETTRFPVAVVSAGTLRSIDGFARQLASILRTFGPTLSLRKDLFRDVCHGSRPDIARNGELARLLSHLEYA